MNNKYRLTAIFLILCVALVTRFYRIENVPPSLYWDEMAMADDGYSLAYTGKDINNKPINQAIFYSYGDYKAPVYIWLTTISIKLLGPTITAIRLPSILAGMIAIMLTYLLALELFASFTPAIWSALFMAICPWAIQFSRAAFEANLALCFTLLSLYSLLKARRSSSWLLITAISAAASVYSYFSARLVVPLLILSIFVIMRQQFQKNILPWMIGSALLFSIILLPLIMSPDYHRSNQFRMSNRNLLTSDEYVLQQNVDRQFSGNTRFSRLVYHRWWNFMGSFIGNVAAHADPRYLFIKGDPNLRHGTATSGVLLLFTLPIFISGILEATKHKRLALVLGGWWFVSLIPAALVFETPHSLRTLAALPVYMLVLGLGMNGFKRYIWVVFIILVINFGSFFHDYLTHYPVRAAESWQYSTMELARLVHEFENTYTHIYVPGIYNFGLYQRWYSRLDHQAIYHVGDWQITDIPRLPTPAIVVISPQDYVTANLAYPIIKEVKTLDNTTMYYIISIEAL